MTGVCSLCVREPISQQSTTYLCLSIWHVHMLLPFSTENRQTHALFASDILAFTVYTPWRVTVARKTTDRSHTPAARFHRAITYVLAIQEEENVHLLI